MVTLEKTFKTFLVLQTILSASGTKSTSQVTTSSSEDGYRKELKTKVELNLKKNEKLYGNDNNSPMNRRLKYDKIRDLHGTVNSKTILTRKGVRNNDKNTPSSWKFKYALDRKDESGFDLTPEETKTFKIWKDGVIPYYIDVVSFSDKVLRDKIRNFLQMVNSVASINFVELPGPPSDENERWVFFVNRRGLLGCADHTVKNFTNQGVQQVVLGYDCMATRGEVAEAVMSIVGVPAQHNAPNRDKYIKVNMENIMADKKYLFKKLNDNEWLFHDLPYDLDSVTHYDINKYSDNGRATVELLKNPEDLNPVTEFSTIDLLKIKMLYNYITRNRKVLTPVCQKLFRISSKFKPGPESSIRLKPRKKPNRYMGIFDHGAGESIESLSKQEYVESEEFSNNDNDDVLVDDEKLGENGDNETSIENERLDRNPIRGGDTTRQEQNIKKILKGRKKSKQMIDLLHHLSDYDSDEKLQLKAKTH